MIKRLLRATLTFCAACLCTIGTAHAAPEEYGLILTRHETIEIDGNKIAVPIDVWMKSRFADGSAYFDLWADADLSELQEKASDIAGRMGRYRSCGDRVRVSSAVLEPGEEKARFCMRVRYEKWQCVKASLPGLSGFKLSFKKGAAAKTRLVSQNAHICADMWPVVAEDGQEVRLEGKVTKNAVSGRTGLFGDLFNVRGKFRARLRREINRAMANLKLPMPDALNSFDPVVNEAWFRTREDGTLGMVTTMHVKVEPSDLPQILALLSSD